LEFCHDGVSKEFDEEVAKREVDHALQAVKIHNKYQHTQPTTQEEPIDKDNYRLVLECIHDLVQSICDYIRDPKNALAEQHGGILKHGGIKSLMNKLANAVDVAHQQSYWEQLSVLHSVQHASTNGKASEKLEELLGLIEGRLRARG
jgi:hypothetical protein